MTTPAEKKHLIRKLVLFSDLCSSTSILEDLLRTENQKRWRNLLIGLKNFLRDERDTLGFIMYKFIGDGWVLLFDEDFSPVELFGLLSRLCDEYDSLFNRYIKPVLSTVVEPVGITFGLDRGTLMKVTMDGKAEYIGRPLNVAARLQGSIKDKDHNPHGKVLMSKNAYAEIRDSIKDRYHVVEVKRELLNIAGGDNYRAKKLYLFQKPK
jgi:class 3 adenylate cyclase